MDHCLQRNCIVCGSKFDRTHWRAGQQKHCSLACRFWEKVEKNEVGCWNWKASFNTNGYGQISINKKPKIASRVSYTLTFGEIPETCFVLHSCDNPSCVNPDHLFIGSHVDNMADMAKKGRAGSLRMTDQRKAKAAETMKKMLASLTPEQKAKGREKQTNKMILKREEASIKTKQMWADPAWRKKVLNTRKSSKAYSDSRSTVWENWRKKKDG